MRLLCYPSSFRSGGVVRGPGMTGSRKSDLVGLDKLRQRIATCRACESAGILAEAHPITGPVRDARVMVVGQAPGPVTHREGVHFAGPAGRTLAGWMERAGYPPGDFHKWP